MSLKLITETVQDVRALTEAVEGDSKRTYFIEGIFMQGDLKNQNGRIYQTEVLAREANRYQEQYIKRKRSFGELGHPDSPTVNLDRASHLITQLQQDGNNFFGRAKVMCETPMGKIVKALIDEGAELGVSTRGLGSLRDTPRGSEVQDDFFFATVDIVADPSAPDAFVRGIMEGREWVWESGALRECALTRMQQTLDAVHAPTVSSEVRREAALATWGTFLTGMAQGVTSKIIPS